MSALSHGRRSLAKRACTLPLVAALCACAQSDHELLEEARRGLADAAYTEALAAAERGLKRNPEQRIAWGLELVGLEARARSGLGDEAVAQLERLGGAYPQHLPPTQYAATALQLRRAGQGPAAIETLDMGLKRFPGDATLDRLIGEASTTGDVDSAELEMLRSLGYID